MSTAERSIPSRPLRALVGGLCAGAVVGVGHAVAGFTSPAASPVIAVAQQAVFLAPQPVKEIAVKYLGNADKPVLIAGVMVVLAILAATIGIVAWWRLWVAVALVVGLGAVGLAASFSQDPSISGALPALIGTAVGVVGLILVVDVSTSGAPAKSVAATTDPAPVSSSAATTDDPAPTTSTTEKASAKPTTPGTSTAAPATPRAPTLRRPDRRTFLGAVGLATVAVAGGAIGQLPKRPGGDPGAFGLPTPASPAKPLPDGIQAPGAVPFQTPAADFYRVDISLLTPQVDASKWQLKIDGMVDRPITLSYADLLAMPMIERDITLCCVSNEVGGPYVSTGRWLGVPFSEIISRVGMQPGVDQLFSYSSDSGYTCSTPIQALTDGRDAMIAVGLNGGFLPDRNGFPARMLVPGLFGFVSATKWLTRLEFTTYAARTAYWTERQWATDAPVLTQCRIDVPKGLGTITKENPVLAGVAWAQHRGIEKVEIQIDDGPWQECNMAVDAGIDLWRQWWFKYDGPPGRHSASVRATDQTGATQPQERTPVFPRGATGWHSIQFVAD